MPGVLLVLSSNSTKSTPGMVASCASFVSQVPSSVVQVFCKYSKVYIDTIKILNKKVQVCFKVLLEASHVPEAS
jgi:hypothetical protein